MAASFAWDVGRLPFLWTPLEQGGDGAGLPDRLPFTLGVSEETGALVQLPVAEVSAALVRAYDEGSVVSGLMEESGIGRSYADDILGFIDSCVAPGGVAGMRVLEIGCGSGYLLHRLRERGADVLGIEPGGRGLDAARRYEVPIVRGFFPSAEVSGPFDLIIMYAVLEHIERPVDFLRTVRGFLGPGGRAVIAVPDCEPYIAGGDISILIHEHWSYFTPATVRDTARAAGLGVVRAAPAGFGGSAYLCAEPAEREAPVAGEAIALRREEAHRFRELAERRLLRLAAWLADAEQSGSSAGIYVPGRAINALALAGAGPDRFRFFDDDPRLHGTFLPGFDIVLESREQLLADPPDRLLIMSRTFGARIAAALSGGLPISTIVETWDDLFERGSNP